MTVNIEPISGKIQVDIATPMGCIAKKNITQGSSLKSIFVVCMKARETLGFKDP